MNLKRFSLVNFYVCLTLTTALFEVIKYLYHNVKEPRGDELNETNDKNISLVAE